MKSLYKLICEMANIKNKALEALYSLVPNGDRNRCPTNLKSNRHSHELMRGYFGDDEKTAIYNAKTMLSAGGIDIEKLDFEYGKFGDASGKYYAIKIVANDNINSSNNYNFKLNKSDYLYIINTVIGHSKIRAKTLSPKNIGLTSKSYSDKESLIAAVKTGLKNKNLSEYEDIIMALCGCIQDNSNDLALDEILDHTISYTVNKSSIKNIDDISIYDLNNIANDFGEVLGPLMLMDKLSGNIKLSYPDNNTKLFDYYINDSIKISAKAGKGAVPSSVDTMKAVENLYKNGNITAVGQEQYFLETIVPIIADDNKKGKESSIRKQTWKLAIELANNNENLKQALNVLTDYGLIVTEKGILGNDVNKIYNSGKLNDLLTVYYSALGYKPSPKYSINNLIDKFNTFENKVKEGMILYPLKVAVTNYINTVYSEYVSKYAKMVMNVYQMYFNYKIIGDNIEISFCTKAMCNGDFKLRAQGSVGEPILKSMGIEMIK